MKKYFTLLALSAMPLFINQNCIYAQEIDTVLIIDDVLTTKRELRSLLKAKNHQEYEVIVRKVNSTQAVFSGENGYLLVFCYMEDHKLQVDWVEYPTEEIYDRLYYKWEPDTLEWHYENSYTGAKGPTMQRMFE